MSLSLHKVPFLDWTYTGGDISNMTDMSQRMVSAGDNLRQTLPLFLVLSCMSIILEVDNLLYAQIWFGFRITYLVGAVLNVYRFKLIRPLIWIPSIIMLIRMATNLVS
jgi:uncharacterized MAPEG superfamily protein